VRIAGAALDDIVAHARQAAPAECCGLLIGRPDVVTEAVRARNIAPERTRFLIDPHDHIAARRRARGVGLDLVGFYHSHPTSLAEPSQTDLDEATYPNLLYLIVSLVTDTADVRLFRLRQGWFEEVAFEKS
jgi:proteasome lid subunit RPN8/RPN11